MGCYADGDDDLGVNYFGRLDHTMFTLFMLMSMENWSDIIRMTDKEYPWAWIPLLTFMIISAFVMLNLVIAVLCEALSALKDETDEQTEATKKIDEEATCITKVTDRSDESDLHQSVISTQIEALQKIIEERDETMADMYSQMNDMKRALKGIVELQLFVARNVNKN